MATCDFQVGDVVRCEREAPTRGTWRNYAGKVGTVVVADNYGEVGVAFSRPGTALTDLRPESWFLPNELVHAPERRSTASLSPSSLNGGPL